VLNDFAQISLAARYTMLLAVPPASPYKSVTDVVEAARQAPGKLNLGAINPGSTQNLSAHLFQQVSGAQFTVVTYRTTPDLVTALLRGEVDLGFDYYAGFESTIGPGKLHIIATSGEERASVLKDVPTVAESGLPGYVVTGWNGVAAPAGVPAPIIATLSAGIRRAWPIPMFRTACGASGSKRREARPKTCTTRWRGKSPSGARSSRRPAFRGIEQAATTCQTSSTSIPTSSPRTRSATRSRRWAASSPTGRASGRRHI
jgi:tripartite-type tricarboxylate transporter receptor subunit TctC